MTMTYFSRESAAIYCGTSLSTFLRKAKQYEVKTLFPFDARVARYRQDDLDKLKSALQKEKGGRYV
jgi:hypothetical protein